MSFKTVDALTLIVSVCIVLSKVTSAIELNAAEEKWEEHFEISLRIDGALASIDMKMLARAAEKGSFILSSVQLFIVRKLQHIGKILAQNAFTLPADMGMDIYENFKKIFIPDVTDKYFYIQKESANIYRILRIEHIENINHKILELINNYKGLAVPDSKARNTIIEKLNIEHIKQTLLRSTILAVFETDLSYANKEVMMTPQRQRNHRYIRNAAELLYLYDPEKHFIYLDVQFVGMLRKFDDSLMGDERFMRLQTLMDNPIVRGKNKELKSLWSAFKRTLDYFKPFFIDFSETHKTQAALVAGHKKLDGSSQANVPTDNCFEKMKLNDPLLHIIQHMEKAEKVSHAIKLRGLQADTALSVQIKHKSSFPEEDTNQNHHQFSECVELVNAYSLIDINRKERALVNREVRIQLRKFEKELQLNEKCEYDETQKGTIQAYHENENR